jgi:hypothetical protein
VYYALTLPNAEFEFSAELDSVERTINQPWTQVVLEGLRRLDEGIVPGVAFPEGFESPVDELETDAVRPASATQEIHRSYVPAFLGFVGTESITKRRPLFIGAAAVAVLASVAVIGVPAGWYHHPKAAAAANQAVATTPSAPESSPIATAETPKPENTETNSHTEDPAALAAKRQREKDRAKAREARATEGLPSTIASVLARPGAKKVVVTVSYDESGRVTQASGGDATALRIARQKRFPPGKAGSTTVTIPIN